MGKEATIDEIERHIDELLEEYKKLPKDTIHWYFNSFLDFAPSLKRNEYNNDKGNQHALSMLIAYLYIKIESAQREILYGAAITRHRTDKDETRYITENFYMTREIFYTAYNKVMGNHVNKEAKQFIVKANKVRNAIMHGRYKTLTEHEKREAIIAIFNYSKSLSEQVKIKIKDKFEPFGKLKEPNDVKNPLNRQDTIEKLERLGIKLEDEA